ncbi:RUN domain-containing protein 1-like isoform X1 [Apostichopus japonicus]|uniref:RUN domain-containing protein 1-like isoform X1 n=2 Tax=Stichopus japonicus TaxID=307972 RepID=UPI003AB5EC7A
MLPTFQLATLLSSGGQPIQKIIMMEDTSLTDDSLEFGEDERPKNRLAPLGAVASPPEVTEETVHPAVIEQLKHLEDEQEELNSSLLALTSHFAQVQFRLKQIISAEPEDKETLLKELEEFAFQGCPDVRGCRSQDAQMLENDVEVEHEKKIAEQREKQMELIAQLKCQLDDIEQFAYQEGTGIVPHTVLMEKQKAIIEELQAKLDMQLEDYENMSTDELKNLVDSAIGKIVNPARVKGQVITQLKNQICDLERFISFLQGEAQSPGPLGHACTCPVHGPMGSSQDCGNKEQGRTWTEQEKKERDANISAMKKALSVLQYIAVQQLGCGTDRMKERKQPKKNDSEFQTMLQKLDKVVVSLIRKERQRQREMMGVDEDYSSDDSDSPVSRPLDDVTITVRREFAPILKHFFEFGLVKTSGSRVLMTPITACLSPQVRTNSPKPHAWDIFERYFQIKHGKEFSESPARCLSQAFDLNIVGGTAITSRQILLATIHAIEESHNPLKRSPESRFKALICEALNQRKLSVWCKHLYKTKYLIENNYVSWSYMSTSKFDSVLQILDKLNELKFHLPADLAVKQFTAIKDAF